ncbi:MAG: DNA-methyltransferase [Actinocrinis sp.]
MSAPYYADALVELYLGDCRDVLPTRDIVAISCVTDPPYGETSAAWDRWPVGWVDAVAAVLPPAASLWCFGSARMFLEHRDDFAGWRFAQEALWVKRNGTGPTSRDRLVKIHEWAYHWYRGRWSDLHHEWERTACDGPDKGRVRRTGQSVPQHQGAHLPTAYLDDGTRQPRSVTYLIEAPSVRYQKRHQDEKPLATVIPLVRECTPPDGVVLDVFAGTGTTGVAAKHLGRRAILIEADEATCEIAAKRLAEDLLPVGEAS